MTKGFLERTQQRYRLRYGREMTPTELADQVAMCDREARLDIIEEFENDRPEEGSARALADRLSYSRAIYGTHDALDKAGR